MNIEHLYAREQRREDRKPNLYLAVVLIWFAIVLCVISGCQLCPAQTTCMERGHVWQKTRERNPGPICV